MSDYDMNKKMDKYKRVKLENKKNNSGQNGKIPKIFFFEKVKFIR